MEELSGQNKFIKCSKCKCKYINDDEHIKSDFGYNRLNIQYKCCVKCRNKENDYYKRNANALCDTKRKYYEPCSICNTSVYKYQMSKHQASPICVSYAERANKLIEK